MTGAAESSAPGGPSATIDQSSSSSSSATASSASASATASTKKSSNTGPIVGGVVGGILGLAILGVAGFFVYRYFKNKEQQAKAQPFYGNHIDPPYPTEGKMSVPPLSPNEFNPLLVNQPPMKIYVSCLLPSMHRRYKINLPQNPEDPSTFPTFAANTPSVSTYPSSQAALIPNRSPPPIEV